MHQQQHHPPRVVAAPHSGQPPYPAQPYGYPGYAPYGSHQPQASTSKAPGANPEPAPSVKDPTEGATSSGDSAAAAYEAAQSILKAINFGDLLKLPPDEQHERTTTTTTRGAAAQSVGDGVEQLLSHVQAILAAENAEEEGTSAPSSGLSLVPLPTALPASAETRAELQAQLALLSAQLAELAQTECQSEAVVPHLAGSQPIMNSLVADRPSSSTTTVAPSAMSPSVLPSIETSVEGGVDSDEDDMEEII